MRNVDVNNLKISEWINRDAFVGLYFTRYNTVKAVYSWHKEGTGYFSIYTITHGHLEKFGTVKVNEIESIALDRPLPV